MSGTSAPSGFVGLAAGTNVVVVTGITVTVHLIATIFATITDARYTTVLMVNATSKP